MLPIAIFEQARSFTVDNWLRGVRRLRIVCLIHSQNHGGATVSFLHLFREILRRQPELHLICQFSQIAEYFKEELNCEASVNEHFLLGLGKWLNWGTSLVDYPKNIRILRDLLLAPFAIRSQTRAIRKASPDLIYISSASMIVSGIAAACTGRPVVWHIRETLLGSSFSLRKRIAANLIGRISTKIICCGENEKRQFPKRYQSKIAVIPHPVNVKTLQSTKRPREDVRQELGIEQDQCMVLTLGGANHWKGLVEILQSFESLPESFRLVSTGAPPGGSKLKNTFVRRLLLRIESILVRLGVQSHVQSFYDLRVALQLARSERKHQFLGYQPEVASFLSAADIVIFFASAPHYPRGIYEAWAMKAAVVSTSIPGITDHARDHHDAILISKSEQSALSEALLELWEKPEQRDALATAGEKNTLTLCNPDEISERVWEVFRQTVPSNAEAITARETSREV